MGRLTLTALTAVCTLLLGSLPALAAVEPDDVASEVDFRGYFIEDGAPADINEMERLATDYRDRGFVFIALDADPDGGADLFADAVRQSSAARTVIVVSRAELGFVSDDYDDAALSDAADAAIGLFDQSYEDGFRRFATELMGVAAVPTSAASEAVTATAGPVDAASDGGGGGIFVFLIIIAAVVVFFWWMSRRSKQRRHQVEIAKMEELKAAVREEMSGAANEILELEDRIRVADNDRASDLYAEGAKGYAEFQEDLEQATTPEQIHDLGNRVDRVLWQLEAAEAIIEGRDVPPEPEPEPFPEPEQAVEAQRRPDLPPEIDIRRERPQRIPTSSARRGGGFGSLGGLGSIAVILREMQRAASRQQSGRVSTRRTGRTTRRSGSGVEVPWLPTSSSTGRRSSRSGSSSRTRSGRSSRPKGRGRRRR